MQCYSELLPPTAVTHAVALPFLKPDETNLIVAKTSLLQVFHLKKGKKSKDAEQTTKLLLVGEYPLSGTVTSLRRVHALNSKSGADALLIGCRDAKVSLVEWDQENYRISTISIHYYEGEVIPRQPFEPNHGDGQSILTVDPDSRCAALKFWQRQLAILPFRQIGDDPNEMDGDIDMDGRRPSETQLANGEAAETPYEASFVVSLPSLDDSLTDVVDLAFLHEYREPTFGILTALGQASSAHLNDSKDDLIYHVLTLDLEQRASTILVSVQHLPVELWKVIPLRLPVGGALLIGTNELLHVAQSGKVHAVSVNEYAESAATFPTADQSDLNMRLEDCAIDVLDEATGDMLVASKDGSLAILSFVLLGPDVKGLHISTVAGDLGGRSLHGIPSCVASLGDNHVFVGSDEADSVLLAYQQQGGLGRKRSHAEMLGKETNHGEGAVADDDIEEDDAEDDDLYTTTAERARSLSKAASQSKATALYHFTVQDQLQSLGPISDVSFGRASNTGNVGLEMVAPVGRGPGSRLAVVTRELTSSNSRAYGFENAKAAWGLRATKPARKSARNNEGPDNYLFVYDDVMTKVFELPTSAAGEAQDPIDKTSTEFEYEGETVDMGVLGSGRWIVQCRRSEIRTYEPDLSLSQILPMADEETDEELSIVHTSFLDPYLLVLRNDGSLQILRVDPKTKDIEPLDVDAALAGSKWISGCLYSGEFTDGQFVAFMLKDDMSLHVLSLPEMKTIYLALNPAHLPPILMEDAALRRIGFKETLTEILVADIGPCDGHKPYLVMRSATEDLALYEPFQFATDGDSSWFTGLRFRKVPTSHLPKYDAFLEDDSESRVPALTPLKLGHHYTVAVPGQPPSLILSESNSRPKVLRLRSEDAVSVVSSNQAKPFNSDDDVALTVLTSSGGLHQYNISHDTWIGTGWAVQKLKFGHGDDEVRHIAYHEQRGIYVVSTCKPVDFFFADEDIRHPDQDDITLRPQVPQYSLHLFSAGTRRIIHTYELPPGNVVTSVEVMPMDASEHTHEVKHFVVVGTASLRGEDMPSKGALTIFELLSVVPEPGDPETGVKLQVFSREETKGAVTAAAPFVGGLVGTSQGQKIIIRGLKEDGSCLPVAFLDAQCQTSTLKTLGHTGMWLVGDAWKGLWLGGFTEDPYKLTFLGKTRTYMEVICAEFLPFEESLFILAVDADMDLHIFQYDPEDPKTVSGTRLLHRSTFNIGHWPTSMTLLPSTLAPADEQTMTNGTTSNGDVPHALLYHILVTTQSGAVNLITPLDAGSYRRLGNLHGQMASILEHAAALNPREYRAVDGDAVASRGVIDGLLIQRVGELGSARRAEVLARCGSDEWTLKSDLELIGGGGLAWL